MCHGVSWVMLFLPQEIAIQTTIDLRNPFRMFFATCSLTIINSWDWELFDIISSEWLPVRCDTFTLRYLSPPTATDLSCTHLYTNIDTRCHPLPPCSVHSLVVEIDLIIAINKEWIQPFTTDGSELVPPPFIFTTDHPIEPPFYTTADLIKPPTFGPQYTHDTDCYSGSGADYTGD